MHVRRVALCNVIHTLILHYTRTFILKANLWKMQLIVYYFCTVHLKLRIDLKRLHIPLSTCRRPIHILFNFACFRIELLNSILRNLSFALSLAL